MKKIVSGGKVISGIGSSRGHKVISGTHDYLGSTGLSRVIGLSRGHRVISGAQVYLGGTGLSREHRIISGDRVISEAQDYLVAWLIILVG